MANEQNLESMKGKAIDSTEKARRLGAIGGKKSGESKRRNKEIRERMKIGIDLLTQKLIQSAKEQKRNELAKELDEIGAEVFSILEIAQSKKVKAETRLKAWNDIMDRIDGKATQRNELSGLDGQPLQPFQIVVEGVQSNNL